MKQLEGFKHGINLGGWFSQCDYSEERYDTFIREEDFRVIAGWGLDHVRVPVDYNLLLSPDGSFSGAGFARLSRCACLCRENGLNMVLDLHKAKGFSFDDGEGEAGFFESEKLQDGFVALWKEIAERFGRERHIAFELLNEVTDREYGSVWNRVARRAMDAIRLSAPETKIIVGGYYHNSPEAVKDLEPPRDENIVYTFHCYSPLIYTHQAAYWISGMNPDFRLALESPASRYREETLRVLGEDFLPEVPKEAFPLTAEYFLHAFAEAAACAEERGVPLYCGEYGVIDRADPEDTLKWYSLISEAFDKLGIGRAAWSYREMDFGLTGPHYASVLDRIIPLL